MSWRVVAIASRAKLETHMGYLLVRTVEETRKVFLDEIATLLIESTGVSLTTALLCDLTKRKINVIFCDATRNPQAEIIPYYGCHDSSEKIRKQMAWTQERKDALWTRIVKRKIQGQMQVLRARGLEQADMLAGYLGEIKVADTSNREGHAAKVYFNALFGKGFSRDRECSINAALNYGYAIILSAVNREICALGYLTQLGLCHANVNNPFNLGCDLMEPLRPFVDVVAVEYAQTEFEKEQRYRMVGILGQDAVIEGRVQTMNNAMKTYVKSAFDALNDGDAEKISFIGDEL